MTAEEVLQKVRESMEVALRQFIGEKQSAHMRYNVRNAILNVLQNYYQDGTIDEIPLVDINHETELASITNDIRNLNLELEGTEDYNSRVQLQNEIAMLSCRADALRSQLPKDPNGISVFLKNPITYGPFILYGRSDYEQ